MADLFIPFQEAVDALREELLCAVAKSSNEALRFRVSGVDLEFTVVAKREGSGTIKFSILGIGADGGGKLANEQTQKVKLSLVPEFRRADQASTELWIADDSAPDRDAREKPSSDTPLSDDR